MNFFLDIVSSGLFAPTRVFNLEFIFICLYILFRFFDSNKAFSIPSAKLLVITINIQTVEINSLPTFFGIWIII